MISVRGYRKLREVRHNTLQNLSHRQPAASADVGVPTWI
jgi:hypothetical protein